MIKPSVGLARLVADTISSTEPGSFGPVLRGLLVAIAAVREPIGPGEERRQKLFSLAELVENATVYAERNNL